MQDFLFYLQLGWEHIISKDALDHQLFILALIAIFSFRDWKKVLILVTAFTIGHSLTLVLSALDVFRFPSDWVEFLIPCTIVFTALDNIIFSKNEKKLIQLNYYLALLFGLIHGMGFANSVRMMLASEQDITLPLYVRNKKNGDKIYVKNMDGSKKVKDIFIDSKIPKNKLLLLLLFLYIKF